MWRRRPQVIRLIPEIIGRLPILTHLDPLDRNALRRVLTEPKNAITKQYEKLFAMDGVKLKFEPEALDMIVDKAIEYKLGARGLRAIVETVMIDSMFELPSSSKKHSPSSPNMCWRNSSNRITSLTKTSYNRRATDPLKAIKENHFNLSDFHDNKATTDRRPQTTLRV